MRGTGISHDGSRNVVFFLLSVVIGLTWKADFCERSIADSLDYMGKGRRWLGCYS